MMSYSEIQKEYAIKAICKICDNYRYCYLGIEYDPCSKAEEIFDEIIEILEE